MGLSTGEKTTLMRLARAAVLRRMNGLVSEFVDDSLLTGALVGKRGVVVSIFSDTVLKGSMGYVMPILPLWKAVTGSAINAAFHDQRFSPLTRQEVDSSKIEISVLTAPAHIRGIAGFVPGVAGLLMRKGFRQAVLLPQGAARNGWDVSGVLAYLSRSVGLAPGDWERADSLEAFQAESFHEM